MEDLHLHNDEREPFRSKLYILDGEDGWLDQGTGFPILTKEKDKDILKFSKEDTGHIIYQVEISNDLQFDQQEEKIFTWFSESTNTDMALSFQNEVGAETLWQRIQEILSSKKRYFGPLPQGICEDESLSVGSEIFEDFTLSIPQEDKLARFEAELIKYASANSDKKNAICHLLYSKCPQKVYFDNLINIFHKAEDEKDELKLTILFRIFRHIISLAYYDLYVLLLDDEYYMDVFGILEYDPHPDKKASLVHRKYFEEYKNIKPISNISDKEILKTINWNFRLIYLRDYVLGHHLDERILQFISAIIQSNYIDILKYIQTSKEFLSSLFDLLRSQNLNALKIIHEMCVVMKNLEVFNHHLNNLIFSRLTSEYGLFESLEELMTTSSQNSNLNKSAKKEGKKSKEEQKDSEKIDPEIHLQTILEILMLSLVQAPQLLREYCLSPHQKIQKYPLLTFLGDKATTHPEPVIQNMLVEAIKHLIDIGEGTEENTMHKIFYEQNMTKIIKVFDNPSKEEAVENGKSMALDLLVYCAKQQIGDIRKTLVTHENINKIFQTFNTENKFLILQTVQFYKLLLRCKEPEIISPLVNPLGIIINYFIKKCKEKHNLLHSSILEVFHIILQEEIFVLLKTIIKGNYQAFLEDPQFADISTKLKEKFSKLNSGEIDMLSLDERKQSDHSYTRGSRKPSGSFSLESPPLGNSNNGTPDSSIKKPGPSSPKHGNSNNNPPKEKMVKRTSSNMAKTVDYDTEMDFNTETRGKDPNFMIEDIHVKKRKLDEINSIKILNKTSHTNEIS